MQHEFIKNFEGVRIGYHLMTPFIEKGMCFFDKRFFNDPKRKSFSKSFYVMNGVDLEGAYFIKSELRKLIEDIISEVISNPLHVNVIHKEVIEKNQEYWDFAHELEELDLKNLSDVDLADNLSKLYNLQEESHSHALATTWFIDSDGEDFSKYLIERVDSYVKDKSKIAEVFSVLTTPSKLSIQQEGELEFLKLVSHTRENKKLKSIFLKNNELMDLYKELPKDIQIVIENYCKKWRWTPFGYMGPAYDLDYYLQVIGGLIKDNTNVEQEIEKISSFCAGVIEKKEKIYKDLKISKDDKEIFNIASDIIFIKGHRKDVMYYGFYVLSILFKEFAKRKSISLSQTFIMSHREIIDSLINDSKVEVDLINKRNKRVVLVEENRLDILVGQEVDKFLSKVSIEKEVIDLSIKELKGSCSCNGFAKGFVKIVNIAEEMGKMNNGDIMVSHTTFPALVPAMKKASAIVTEDGGITCHAAIVSRELGTPCITGVKNATKVLKDGMKVEVDANHGVIRILST